MGVGTLRGIRIEHALVGDVAALMGHPPRASIRRYAASAVYLLLGGCGADTDTADPTPPKGLIHVAHTTTGDYVDLDASGTAVRADGNILSINGWTARYASTADALCDGRARSTGFYGPLCSISDGVVSGPEDTGYTFDWTLFEGANRVAVSALTSDQILDIACATGPSVTPCQGDTSPLMDEADFLASLPTALDIRFEFLIVKVLEDDGSLVSYSNRSSHRDPPIPDAAGMAGWEMVLDDAGTLWTSGQPVWLGDDLPKLRVVAADETVIAFDDGSTWFDVDFDTDAAERDRYSVSQRRPGVRFPAAPTRLYGNADVGAALVDADLWVWASESFASFVAWDSFTPDADQFLGWE